MKHTLDGEAFADLVAAVQLLDDLQAEILYAEVLVWHLPEKRTSRTIAYAGTMDLLLKLPPDGRAARKLGWRGENPIIVVADLKTGQSVWEGPLAVGAYARATHLVEPDGTVIPMPTVHKGLVLHCHEGVGASKFVDIEEAWRQFLTEATSWRNIHHRQEQLLVPVPDMQAVGKRIGVEDKREGLRRRLNYYFKKGAAAREDLLKSLPDRLDVMTAEQMQAAHGVLSEKWGQPSGKDSASPDGMAHLIEESVRTTEDPVTESVG